MGLRTGTLRHRAKLQQRSAAQDTLGGQITTWSDVATIWCDIQPLSGRELLAAQAVQSDVEYSVVARYRSEFATPKAVAAMRLLYGSRMLNIVACMNVDERNRTVELRCSEGLNDG